MTLLVAGVQRSGTNMVLGALESSREAQVYRESDPRAFDGYYLRPLPRLTHLKSRCRRPLLVLKALLDSHMIAEFLSYLAPTKAVWVYRHYADVVNSNLRKWPGGRNQIEDLMEDPYRTGFRGRGITAETLSIVRAHYHPGLSDASAIALFWYYRNQLFFDQKLEDDPRVQLIRYEEMVTNPDDSIRRLCGFLGIQYVSRMTTSIHSNSISRHAAPDIDTGICNLCEGMLQQLESFSRPLTAKARWETDKSTSACLNSGRTHRFGLSSRDAQSRSTDCSQV